MPRRKPIAESAVAAARPGWPWRLIARRWLWPFLAVVFAAAILLAGLVWIDQFAREQIVDDERYQVAFTDIECEPPPGMTRAEFLDEVLYYDTPRSLPARFSLLEAGLESRLQKCFTRHPWVDSIHVDLKRPTTVVVHAAYRQAMLAVEVTPDLAGPGFDRPAPGEQTRGLRAIDAKGVLLPKKAPIPRGLVVLEKAPRPHGAAGQPWGDPIVELAAKTAVWLKAGVASAREIQLTRMEWTAGGLVLWGQGMKVLWGKEASDEPPFGVKIQRILDTREQRANLGRWVPLILEIDVRPRDRALVRMLDAG